MKAGKYIFLILALLAGIGVKGQNVALKSNLLSDAFANVNLGVEVRLAKKWSLDITGDINNWSVNHHKWKHWAVQPEIRYWLCDIFAGHFFGLHVLGGQYNFGNIRNNVKFLGSDFSKLSDYRYQGWAAGAGIAYGYSWILAKHWNIEAEIGVGWMYTRYDKYNCSNCGRKLEDNMPHNYFGPTKLALNLEYIF